MLDLLQNVPAVPFTFSVGGSERGRNPLHDIWRDLDRRDHPTQQVGQLLLPDIGVPPGTLEARAAGRWIEALALCPDAGVLSGANGVSDPCREGIHVRVNRPAEHIDRVPEQRYHPVVVNLENAFRV